MSDAIIDEELVQRLQKIAEREHRSVTEVVRTMLDRYSAPLTHNEALLAMDGMFDDDITDLSSITKEDVMEAYRKKYADSN